MKIKLNHPTNNDINYAKKVDRFKYEPVCILHVPDDVKNPYEWAFKKTQGIEGNLEFDELLQIRSTCVGDIMLILDQEEDKYFMVDNVGFKEVPESFITFGHEPKIKNKNTMIHSFYKDNQGWFIDLPEFIEKGFGTKSNLAMVAGADKMLDRLSEGGNGITLEIGETPFDGAEATLKKSGFCLYGENYIFSSDKVKEFKVWLCPVTKYVFGGKYPATIYIKKIS